MVNCLGYYYANQTEYKYNNLKRYDQGVHLTGTGEQNTDL